MTKPAKVGYGNPPNGSQFRKGQSGNPQGRPKGSKNLATLLRLECDRIVTVTEGGKRRQYHKGALLARIQIDKALKGDVRAFTAVHAILAKEGLSGSGSSKSPAAAESEIPDEVYDQILAALIAESGEKKK